MSSQKASILLLGLDGLVVDKLVLARLDLLRSLALLDRGLALVIIVAVLDGSLLAALLGSGLGLGSGERGVCSTGTLNISGFSYKTKVAWEESTYRHRRPQQPAEPR